MVKINLTRRTHLLSVVGGLALLGLSLSAQGDRAERTLPFKIDATHTLAATLGPVSVTTLKITNLGRGYGRGGLVSRVTAPASELSTTIRFAFDLNNPRDEDWQVTFTIELLDKAGKLIDRQVGRENVEGQKKTFNFEYPLLEYALPAVTDFRLTMAAKID